MREGLHPRVQCTCVHLFVFAWPWSVWVFGCLLVSLCGREWREPGFCPLPVLGPPFFCSEGHLVVG